MTEVVIDTSALIAWLGQEQGWEISRAGICDQRLQDQCGESRGTCRQTQRTHARTGRNLGDGFCAAR